MSFILGEKTALKRFEDHLSDAEIETLYRWSRDPELLRWSGGTPNDLSPAEFREHVRGERMYGPSNRRQYLIYTLAEMRLIGRVGLYSIDWNRRDGELGIAIGERDCWNMGYGRDAVHALLRHTFATSSLQTVYLYTFADNIRAQRAFAAVGFSIVERARRFTPEIGEFDGVKMQVSRTSFLSAPAPAANQQRGCTISGE